MSHQTDPAHIEATKVTGTRVYNAQGEQLGTIEDIVLNKAGGEAVYAVMAFGGFLGIGERHHPVPWSLLNYDGSRGGYVVDLTREQLEGAPHHGADEHPNWDDPAYTTTLTDHYSRPAVDPAHGERALR